MDKSHALQQEWSMLFGKHFSLKCAPDLKPENRSDEDEKKVEDDSKIFASKILHDMSEMKDELNHTKSQLNDYDIIIWRNHTNFTNACGHLSRECKRNLNAELCTKAWLKFCTILNTFDIIEAGHTHSEEGMTSVHLCEAPGAFVTCLNHHIATKFPRMKWNWLATTLNPYYDGNKIGIMIDDDRFLKTTLANWNFGADLTGNIMSLENLDYLAKECQKYKNVALVTADGSIDCLENPCQQECLVAPLLYWEFITAINIMCVGANFVLKAFTILEEFTVSLVYLMWCAFSDISITKPGPSKPGNSEVYIVCKGFIGIDVLGEEFFNLAMKRTKVVDFISPLVPINEMPHQFLSRLIESNQFFIRHQILAIQSNIDSFGKISKKKRTAINEMKKTLSQEFMWIFNMQPIDSKDHVSCKEGTGQLQGLATKEHSHSLVSGNFYQRKEMKNADWIEKTNLEEADDAQCASNILWFSNAAVRITKEEVDQWSPFLGKTFEVSKNTQFCSNSVMQNLFEARESMFVCNDRSLYRSTSLVSNLDAISGEIDCQETAVFQISVERRDILVGRYKSISIGEAVRRFETDSHKAVKDGQETKVNDTDLVANNGASGVSNQKCIAFANLFGGECCHEISTSSSARGECCILKKALREMGAVRNNPCTDILISLESQTNSRKGNETTRLQLLLSLFVVMTKLKKGGMFLCEVSDLFTNANSGILYIFSRIFKWVGLYKCYEDSWLPTRLLICKDLVGGDGVIMTYLEKLLSMEVKAIEGLHGDREIIHALPVRCILQCDFLRYLKNANELHSKMQLGALKCMHERRT